MSMVCGADITHPMSFLHISLPRAPRLDTCPRKAVIERCSGTYWYRDMVGQTITVEFIDSDGLWAREGGTYNCINVIRREDASLLPLEN
jgi:hypothetical protein